ncbi:MAG: YceI family protein [Ignavibacteriaceae bacterium]
MDSTTKTAEAVTGKSSWSLDPAHTKIQFSVRHLIISEVAGKFNNFSLEVEKANKDFSEADIELTIDTKSIDTGIVDRDNHLRSADFFDVEKFEKIVFKSTSIKKVDDEKYKLTGNLTIKDITKPIELDVNYGGQIVDPWGLTRAGFKVTGSINRFDYNLQWNALMEAGGAIVGKNINIVCDVEITKKV